MSSTFKTAAIHALQLAAAAFGIVFFEDWAIATFSLLPPWLVLIGLALVSAIVVEIVSLAIVGRPRLTLTWFEENDPQPLAQLTVDFDSSIRTSLSYTVRASLSGGSWLTRIAVHLLAKSDAAISIRFPACPAVAVVDDYPRDPENGLPGVSSNNASGFDLSLRSTTHPRGLWTWATFRFDARPSIPDDLTIEVVCEPRATRGWTFLSAKVLDVRSEVSRIRFRGR